MDGSQNDRRDVDNDDDCNVITWMTVDEWHGFTMHRDKAVSVCVLIITIGCYTPYGALRRVCVACRAAYPKHPAQCPTIHNTASRVLKCASKSTAVLGACIVFKGVAMLNLCDETRVYAREYVGAMWHENGILLTSVILCEPHKSLPGTFEVSRGFRCNRPLMKYNPQPRSRRLTHLPGDSKWGITRSLLSVTPAAYYFPFLFRNNSSMIFCISYIFVLISGNSLNGIPSK